MDLSLKKSLPWLVLAGSGGLADLISDVLDKISATPSMPGAGSEGEGEAATKTDLRSRVTERVLKHFPSEPDTEKLVDKVMRVTMNSITSMFIGLYCFIQHLHECCKKLFFCEEEVFYSLSL